jgi:hypothetical protein
MCYFVRMKIASSFGFAFVFMLAALPASDPYSSLSQSEKELLKPQVERWIRDQIKHDWSDLWEIQDQTPELKNELLLGQKDAPDMDRNRYVQAMRATIGSGYPEIKAFTLNEIQRENGGFRVEGCGRLQRENWKQTSVTNVRTKIVNNKVVFGLPDLTPDPCKL